MNRQTVLFTNPYEVVTEVEPCPTPQAGEVLVRTIVTAVSAGTELLLYRGLMPKELALDATIEGMEDSTQYPTKYGYSAVGEIIACGQNVDKKAWIGRLVFAFQPHQSHFCAPLIDLHIVPESIPPEDAVFLPNMETAVSFVMDGQPVIGENVWILGQGIVGLLTTAVLSNYPLNQLITVDSYPLRRDWSGRLGTTATFNPQAIPTDLPEADLIYELSGNPQALNSAIEHLRFSGRVVIGSWYGQKEAKLDLGGKFHRSHAQLVSSQVSHLNPKWHGRWDKKRRLDVAWQMIKKIRPSQLITHRFPITRASDLYALLANEPETAVQTVFSYD